jgi:hypothetical protein
LSEAEWMPKYVSVTGADVVLKFKGTALTIPTKGYYEHSAENLATLFPDHVRKIELNEIIQEIEKRLLPLHIQEIELPKLKTITINSPIEIPLPQIKEIGLKDEVHEKITKTINSSMDTISDPDLKEFLGMIRDILSSDTNE